jgi:predicted ATPase/DNA-binding winged helix-turn-helix (wHTH) protein
MGACALWRRVLCEAKMTQGVHNLQAQVVSFGPFRLLTGQRMLMEGEKRIRLGSRALEILLLLVERAGELVGKQELIDRVWPNIVVDEAALRVHIGVLRKVLGDGQGGVRYVENVVGRGYRFVAPVAHHAADASQRFSMAADCRDNLPAPISRMIGRSTIVGNLAARATQQRFVTIVGPGGIGKTTVALAVADKLLHRHGYRACFVDLATLSDSLLVPGTLASLLGLGVLSRDAVPSLIAFLKDTQMLIVLDNCEHVVGAAAALAETLVREAPGVHLLATSREPLRSEGEWVHRLSALEVPPPSARLNAIAALAIPAVQLFVERAMASLDSFELSDADVPIIGDICRRLDGIPLAIELVAARVDHLGLHGLAARLGDGIAIPTKGRRTVSPRQQSLPATLDWSYGLLSETEQLVFRRIAVFRAGFDLAAANVIVSDDDIPAAGVLENLLSLADKSLVTVDVADEEVAYRLLETTRAYALEKLRASAENGAISRRHAAYFCTVWEQAKTQGRGNAEWLAIYGRKIDDVRAALDWCFSPDGDAALGAGLAVASTPLWFRLSVLDEFAQRLRLALRTPDTARALDPALDMHLNTLLGCALLWTGGGPGMAAAFHRALELADRLGDTAALCDALHGLGWSSLLAGDYRSAVGFIERAHLGSIALDGAAALMNLRLMALAYHGTGDQPSALAHAERALNRVRIKAPANASAHHVDARVAINAILSRILWVQGFPDRAASMARESLEGALSVGHTLSSLFALWQGCTVFLWTGDMAEADRLVTMLVDHSARHSLVRGQYWGRCFRTVLEVRRGSTTGIAARRDELLRDPRCDLPDVELLGTLIEELAGAEAIGRAESGQAGWCAAEILRAKGTIALRQDASNAVAAEGLFRRSLDLARQQGALSWELRSAMSGARLLQAQGRVSEARDLLAPVHAQFTEGFGTADLMAAGRLLDDLASGT